MLIGLHFMSDLDVKRAITANAQRADTCESELQSAKDNVAAIQAALNARDESLAQQCAPKVVAKDTECESSLTGVIAQRDACSDSCDTQVETIRQQCTCESYINDRDLYYENGRRCEDKLDVSEHDLESCNGDVAYWKSSAVSCDNALINCFNSQGD